MYDEKKRPDTPVVIGMHTSTATDETAPDFVDEHHYRAYEQLFGNLIKLGAKVAVVYDAERTYVKEGVFRESWSAVLDEDKIQYVKNDEETMVDLLYDKNRFPFEDIKRVNDITIRKICRDKYLSYLFAPELHKKSYLIKDSTQLEVFWMSHRDEIVVIKELDSFGGKGVFIGRQQEYKSQNYPLLAQEFLDTSGGFPGLVEGKHDVRVGLFNGEVIYGLLREPAKDGFISNLMYGGGIRALELTEIPRELIEITKKLDVRFGVSSARFFSADFGYDGKEWKLFEMNDSTGVVHKSVVGVAADVFLKLLAEKLVESAKNYEKMLID